MARNITQASASEHINLVVLCWEHRCRAVCVGSIDAEDGISVDFKVWSYGDLTTAIVELWQLELWLFVHLPPVWSVRKRL